MIKKNSLKNKQFFFVFLRCLLDRRNMSDNIQQMVRMDIVAEEKFHVIDLKIVDLLNQASIYGKDTIRVQHLRHVQELILRKDPTLLEQFLDV